MGQVCQPSPRPESHSRDPDGTDDVDDLVSRTRSWSRAALAGVMTAGVIGSVGVVVESAQASTSPFSCSTTRGAFVPAKASISHVGRVKVISVGTNRDGSMGTPPLTDAGKKWLAWYNRSAKPGSGRGAVATDAHTWPDGSALGNKLLKGLVKGDTIVLTDANAQKRVCYRVVSRKQYPRAKVPMSAVVEGSRRSQSLTIVVCSGKRLGPGNWTDRTVWIATVVPAPTPPPPPPPPTTPPPPSGGLLGGLLGGVL